MIILDTHLDIIAAYEEAGRPLDSDTLSELSQVATETPDSYQWVVFEGKCRICNYLLTIIAPYSPEHIDHMECPNCDQLAVQELELEDWQQG